MPRRSADHLALGAFIAGGTRLQPPAHLPAPERAVWLEIVGATPAGHFLPEDVHLLEMYCAAVIQQRQASAAIAIEAKRDRYPMLHWNAQFSAAVKSIRTLTIALRLGPSSRHPVNRKRNDESLSKAASAYELFDDDGSDSATSPRSFDDLRKLGSKEENADEET